MNKKSRAQLDSKPKMYFDVFLLVTFLGIAPWDSSQFCHHYIRQKWCFFFFSGIASNKQILKTKWDPWGFSLHNNLQSHWLSPVFLFPGSLQWVGDVGRKGSPRSFFQAHSYWIWAHEWYVRTRFCVPLKSNCLKPPEGNKNHRRGNGDPKGTLRKKNRFKLNFAKAGFFMILAT